MLTLIRQYRSKRKVHHYNPWNEEAQPGDLVVDMKGRLFCLMESNGRNKRAAGDLTPKQIKPPLPDLCATIIDNKVWWVREEK